ncbi:MAG: class I SAM-dependent methyltransferase [Chloroflexi bacterium]|nr:class I SAM-dependent methyltransferase [Chloroflexota bacterium]
MNPTTAAKLIALNREFYDHFGASFSATRQRLQPGVKRILESLKGDETILDLGCGNGELARALAKRGHRGPYLGLDFSLPLLRDAESQPKEFSARFMEVDLNQLSVISDQLLITDNWTLITAFAVLHHIPSDELRLDILKTVHKLLAEDGRFILSNWQFLNSEKLKARIKPWEASAVSRSEVDAGDYLLDWRSGGEGLRYAHHFTAEELSALAEQSGFRIIDSFLSDGEGGNLGLYQVWKRA